MTLVKYFTTVDFKPIAQDLAYPEESCVGKHRQIKGIVRSVFSMAINTFLAVVSIPITLTLGLFHTKVRAYSPSHLQAAAIDGFRACRLGLQLINIDSKLSNSAPNLFINMKLAPKQDSSGQVMVRIKSLMRAIIYIAFGIFDFMASLVSIPLALLNLGYNSKLNTKASLTLPIVFLTIDLAITNLKSVLIPD